jgi:tetrahydromethanopterin S-methyltransferase subunit A
MNLTVFSKAIVDFVEMIKNGFKDVGSIISFVTAIPKIIGVSREVVSYAQNETERSELIDQILEEFDRLTGKGGKFRIIPSLSEDEEETILDAISIIVREAVKKIN